MYVCVYMCLGVRVYVLVYRHDTVTDIDTHSMYIHTQTTYTSVDSIDVPLALSLHTHTHSSLHTPAKALANSLAMENLRVQPPP